MIEGVMGDKVVNPPHVFGRDGTEIIDVIESFGLDRSYNLGTVVSYILRHEKKGGIEDLRKARWHLEREIAWRSPKPANGQFEQLHYLATPYRHYPHGLDEAYRAAAVLGARLLKLGIRVYAPIVHGHALALYGGGLDPTDHKIWAPYERRMMRVSDVLLVGKLEGWQESEGVTGELDYFSNAGKPIFFVDPDSLEMTPTPIAPIARPAPLRPATQFCQLKEACTCEPGEDRAQCPHYRGPFSPSYIAQRAGARMKKGA